MSTSRADIAATLGTVPGVTVSVTRPVTVQPGYAWPEWVSNRPQTTGCEICEVTWNVWLCLPGDPAAAIEAGDALAREVGAALNKLGAVATYGPAQLAGDDTNTVPALRYEFHSD